LTFVGNGVPFAPSRVPLGTPWTEHALGEEFLTLSV
jgi:hypothetical protein